MSKVPSLSYPVVLSALGRAGFSVVRQKGSHIRLERFTPDGVIKVTVPAHRPIKRSTLQHVIKASGLTLEEFLDLL
ncbi:MAG: type II toxin-antitoxin system HicA family toxin [Deltaproteobacteria bacterium]|nr:type II toxin-antitoxin system HicA family toxin [Deltaproteobacteria bacterium]